MVEQLNTNMQKNELSFLTLYIKNPQNQSWIYSQNVSLYHLHEENRGEKCHHPSIGQSFSNGGNFVFRGTFGNIWRHFWFSHGEEGSVNWF